jgi:CRISPR-associated endonuclease/helicase Cas3
MGGIDESRWYAQPEKPTILVGTQDMLLSRAMNRGYAMGRAAWPQAFGVINTDALWVMDEVQLMGVGLTSSAQIQAFREAAESQCSDLSSWPRRTWWMSATLQPTWLKSAETELYLQELSVSQLRVAVEDRKGSVWDAQKSVSVIERSPDEWAKVVLENHEQHQPDVNTGRQTLVVVNTVKRAKELFADLQKLLKGRQSQPEIRLIHSRFRPYERRNWVQEFLSRDALNSGVNRILVATQVVEAGVDISASCLLSELAPWPSLVQRFGRAARYGGQASVFVLDSQPDEKKAVPYRLEELTAARNALKTPSLKGVSIRDLEEFEEQLAESNPEAIKELYPFRPLHVLMKHEFEELFDTSPDLSGADMDISRFIRESEEERDIQVFWRAFDRKKPLADLQPWRDELCSVSIVDAKPWVKKITADAGTVWKWDYLDGEWTRARAETLRPGMILLVDDDVGGYDPDFGFTGEKRKKGSDSLEILKELQTPSDVQLAVSSDRQEESDSLSQIDEWKTIVTHCSEAAHEGRTLAASLGLSDVLSNIIDLSLRLHDWGKAHPAFANGTYRVDPIRTDLAKAPKASWRAPKKCYETETHGARKGFRHELASCLATLELLKRSAPNHPALIGGDSEMQEALRQFRSASAVVREDAELPELSNSIADEVAALSATDFNLLLYLIASHHGKVRMSLQASPADQEFDDRSNRLVGTGMPIRGVREGDLVPLVALPLPDGTPIEMPEINLSLEVAAIGLSSRYGSSWSERTLELLKILSPFLLGFLEAIVRSADGRASTLTTPDPLLPTGSLKVPLSTEKNSEDTGAFDSESKFDELPEDDTELETASA